MCLHTTVAGSFVTGRNDLFPARMPGLASSAAPSYPR